MVRVFSKVAITLAILALFSCSNDQKGVIVQLSGAQLFSENCAVCHGEQGRGKFLLGMPANVLTERNRQNITEKILQGSSHEESTMPVFTTLDRSQADRISAHLITLKEQFVANGGNSTLLIKAQ